MKKTVVVGLIKKYLLILLGCIIYSLGVALFLDVNKLASGGVTGIAIILNYLIDLPWLNTGIIIVIINVPLFVLGAVFFGKNFILSTIITTVVSSLLLRIYYQAANNSNRRFTYKRTVRGRALRRGAWNYFQNGQHNRRNGHHY